MKTLFHLLCGLALLWLTIPLPVFMPGRTGVYNSITGFFWCSGENSCLHELAHYIDEHNGKPSQTQEFRDALTLYVTSGVLREDHLAVCIISLFGSHPREIYAEIYALTGGNVPPSLKPFYPHPDVEFRSVPVFGGELYYAIH